MKSEKIRKDIHLEQSVIDILEVAASKESRKLKNYIEKVLIKHSEKIKNGLQSVKN